MYDIEVDKLLISKIEPYGKKSSFKYFLGYNDDDDDAIRPLLDFYKDILVYIILLTTFC